MRKTSGSTISWYIDIVLKYAYTFEQKMKNEASKNFLINIIFNYMII